MHIYKVVHDILNLGNIHIFPLLAQKEQLGAYTYQVSDQQCRNLGIYLANYEHLKRVFLIIFKQFWPGTN